jgi:hypothetical protein
MWEQDEPERISTAVASVFAPPVPVPPSAEHENQTAQETLRAFPHLFGITTPIQVNRFENLLTSHPNQPFVVSVVRSLREGFWPWASTVDSGRPEIVDNSKRTVTDKAHLAFMREQRDLEITLGRFSPSFATLQPGMTCVPLWVVPKRDSDNLRLIVDHSAGNYSPNSYIPGSEGCVHLDNLHQLGTALIKVRQERGANVKLVLFKSDISQAYRRLPVHYLWQLHQIVRIDDDLHVDRNNNFGNRGAGRVWFSFFSLVLWIAVFLKSIADLFAYVDDCFSWDFADSVVFYQPYNKLLPCKQGKFLTLLDHLHIPHEERKQIHGERINIIGFEVDANAMTITMPEDARLQLIETVRAFANPRQRRSLRDFQRLAGWVNWALNAYPLLRPGLSSLYDKMRHATAPYTLLSINVSIARELHWLADHLEVSNGIHILSAQNWSERDADVTYLTDACPFGMGYWCTRTCEGFQCMISDPDKHPIFFYEALSVLSAVHHACMSVAPRPSRIAIFTDNENTVCMFNSLHALPAYNPILITAVDWLMAHQMELRVFFIPGELNVVADALSRFDNARALSNQWGLTIAPFTPPRFTLGESAL